jgi:hypothetical protein
MNYILAYSRGWDETQPPDSQPANLLGQDLRQLKQDVRERMISFASGPAADMPAPEAVWGSANDGVIYFQTDTNQLYRWNGAQWVLLRNLDGYFVLSQSFDISVAEQPFNYFYAPFACRLVALRGIMFGNMTSVTLNVQKFNNVGVFQGNVFAADLAINLGGVWQSAVNPLAARQNLAVGEYVLGLSTTGTSGPGAAGYVIQMDFIRL